MMNLDFEIFKNKFNLVKKITWNDIITKFNFEYGETHDLIHPEHNLPASIGDSFGSTMVLRSANLLTPNIENALQEIKDSNIIPNAHLITDLQFYCSLLNKSTASGMHTDDEDVLIVPCAGTITYLLETNPAEEVKKQTLFPGDAMFMPRGLPHQAVPSEPRITMSLSWKDQIVNKKSF